MAEKFDYQRAQATAIRLISKFGATATLCKTAGTYNPALGVETITSVEKTTATLVNLPASGGTVQAFDNRFREQLKTGKLRFFIVAAKGLDFAPDSGQLLEYEGAIWDIEGATPLNPAGLPVVYGIGVKESGKGALPTA